LTHQDDGAIERELTLSGAAATTTYVVSVTTGSVRGAGTDANVTLTLFGVKGDSGPLVLRDSRSFKNKFEQGHTDIFLLEAMDIGDVKKVRLAHDNSGASSAWFVEKVAVEVPSLGKQ
jgi:lipoxygenase homology domain-containing protein 1